MDGLFDDLIPAPGKASGGMGMFDDLIPAASPSSNGAGLFDDLIPKAGTASESPPPATPASQPAAPTEPAQQGDENEAIRQAMARGDQPAGLPPEPAPAVPAMLRDQRPGVGGQFVNDLGRGVDQLQAIGYGLAGMAGDAVGADGVADWGLAGYKRNMEEAKANPPVIGTYRNIATDSLGNFGADVGRYAVEAVAENLPMFLPSLMTGGIGALAARRAATGVVADLVEQKVAQGLTREAAEKAAGEMVARRIAAGGAAGAYPSAAGLEMGSIYGDIEEKTGERRPGVAAAYGAVAGALEAVPGAMALTRVLSPAIAGQVTHGIIRKLGVEGAKQFFAEGGTEALQTVVENAAVTHVDPSKELWSPENIDDMIDSALKGGLAGGIHGMASEGVGNVLRSPVGTRPPVDIAPPNVTPADVASPIPTDLISAGRSIVDGLLAPKADVVDLPQGAVPAQVLLGAVAEPAAAETPMPPPAMPADAAPVQPVTDAGTPTGLQPLYDDETDQHIGWFDPQTGRARPLDAAPTAEPTIPEVSTSSPAPLEPPPHQAVEPAALQQNDGAVLDAPSPRAVERQEVQATATATQPLDFSGQAEEVLPTADAPAGSAPALDFSVQAEAVPEIDSPAPFPEPAAAPILTKSGKPFSTDKAAALAAWQRPDLKGQSLEPVRVDGGWGLRPVDQSTPAVPEFVQPEAPVSQGFRGEMDQRAAPIPKLAQPPAPPTKKKLLPMSVRVENYYRPGRVVQGYGGQRDRVIAFEPAVDGTPWRVRVVKVDQDGGPVAGERERIHSTAPTERDLRAWEKENPAGVARPATPDASGRTGTATQTSEAFRQPTTKEEDARQADLPIKRRTVLGSFQKSRANLPDAFNISNRASDANRNGGLHAVDESPTQGERSADDPRGVDALRAASAKAGDERNRRLGKAGVQRDAAGEGSADPVKPEGGDSLHHAPEFIRAPDGSRDFGAITPEMGRALGREAAPIRLRIGDDREGLRHIHLRHNDDAQALGYPSVEAMVADWARNFDAIYQGRGRSLILAKRIGKTLLGNVVLEPMEEGAYYDVKNVTPGRADQFKNKNPLWERTGPSVSPTEVGSVDPSDQRGNANVAPLTEDGKGGDSLRLAPEFERGLPAIEADLRERLQRYGIADRVGLRLVDAIRDRRTGEPLEGAAGRYGRRIIEVALDARNRTFTFDHEVVHALRDLDLIKSAEWTALQRTVLQDNARMADVRARYPEFGRTDNRPERTERLIEEAVADLFGDWQAGRVQAKGFVRTALERIRDFLRAVGQALRGEGFRTIDSVFRAIDRGEIGRRGQKDAALVGAPAEAHHAETQPRDDQGRFLSDDRLSVEGPVADKTPGASLFGRPQESVGDILRHSAAPLVSRIREASSARAIGESVDRWRANFQDRYLPLLRAQQAIERVTGQPIDEASNPYLGEELSAGRIGAQIEDLTETMVRPLFQDMHRRGVTVQELESFLYARHAPERNARIAEINPKFGPGQGSGMTDGEAEAIMKAVGRSGKKDDLAALAAKVDAVLKFALDTREKAGLLSAEEAKAWRANYKHYVPLRGHEELDADTNTDRPRKPRGVSITGKESQRAFGRESRAADILAYTVMQAEEAIIRAETNHVARQFYDLAKANPAPGFWAADKVAMRRYWNKAKQQVEHRAERRVLVEDKDFTVIAKIDGVEHRVVLDRTNPDAVRLAESMRNLKGEKVGILLQTFGAVNRYLSTVNTSLNPEFVITNAFRDLQTAAINLNQHDIDGIVSGTLKDYPAALKASTKGAFNKGTGDWAKWYDEFRAEGGRVYFNSQDDIRTQRAKIERELKDAAGLHPMKVVRGLFGFIEKANLGVENAVRLAAYKNAREDGLSKARAASLAKNLTVNFNRRGHYGPLINSAYLFYNASIQGTAVLLGAMKHRRVQYVLGAAVLTGAMMEMLNMALSSADDDGEDYYDKISEFEKSRNLIIMNPWGDKGSYFKMPLPYGYNFFYHLGRSAVELSNGKDAGKTMGSLLATLVDSFNPIGGTESLLNLIAPTVFDPVVDLSRNRDYTGKPIKPEQPQYGAKKPESQMFWGSVSPASKTITDFMNEATGGDKVRAGKIDVSPEALDYLFGVATGAAGTFYGRGISALIKLAEPDAELTPNEIPVYRKLVGEKPAWYDRTMFYERAKAVEQLWSEKQAYAKAGEHQKAREVGADLRGLPALKDLAHETRQELSEISKEKTAAALSHEAGRISDGGYRLKTKAMEIREKGLLDRFNRRYRMSLEPLLPP
jgi:hypothetical protein